jgi:hypothetical protein
VSSPFRHAVATAVIAGALSFGGQASAAPEPSVPDATTPDVTAGSPPTVVDNEFLPENADLDECISALPRPECGSKARGGWRQTLIFGILVVVLAIGGWRLVTVLRRRDRAGVEEAERIDAERAARTATKQHD